jgi:hypothetical protein
MNKYVVRKSHSSNDVWELVRNGKPVAVLTEDDGVWSARGAVGEVYGTGLTRLDASRAAAKDPRLGRSPALAMS